MRDAMLPPSRWVAPAVSPRFGMSSAGTAQLFFAAADGLTADALKDADDNLPTPTPSECSDYWDPPCRVCKKVDNEANVLCDICNGAYHLDCIANIKPPLPRQPTDDEWFCRACIKRGIPESIIDRVGRGSSAHYLVKWVGRQLWEVSWETAKELDTPWSRKLIKGYMETERRAEGEPSILPPSHALIDRQARVKELAPTLTLTLTLTLNLNVNRRASRSWTRSSAPSCPRSLTGPHSSSCSPRCTRSARAAAPRASARGG